ncbi:unnamed protein product [Thelazia callipaeda]|uniref:Protein GOLM2 n=1 Tax=Thelazia callipaeda TaxID=103827 RepID=A0A0N5D260_THECL|nr:unnamed protein product [Thelazia callipaeda]
MRWGITRRLILLNTKICALESRLGTRQLSEDLQKKLCVEIGASYETMQLERQKFTQEVVNEERKIVNEVVKSENEAQYDTMHGVSDVFKVHKGGKVESKPVPDKVKKKQDEDENLYENVPKGQKQPPNKDVKTKQDEAPPEIKVPEVAGMVDELDPRYHTLAGMQNEKIFEKKGENKIGGSSQDETQEIKAPTVGGMVDEADPNYQTLVGMHNTKVFEAK